MIGFWTDEKVEGLKKLVEEGMSYSQIARALGCATRNQPLCKANRLGLVHPHGIEKGTPRPRPRTTPVHRERPPAKQIVPVSEPVEALQIDGAFLTLETLGGRMCSYPIGDPGSDDFHYCGHARKTKSSYCEPHHVKCFQPRVPYRRKVDHAAKQR